MALAPEAGRLQEIQGLSPGKRTEALLTVFVIIGLSSVALMTRPGPDRDSNAVSLAAFLP